MRAWLPLLLDDADIWRPLELMLDVASHWCYLQAEKDYTAAALNISRDLVSPAEQFVAKADVWKKRSAVLRTAIVELRKI
jgi:hypothetical protein